MLLATQFANNLSFALQLPHDALSNLSTELGDPSRFTQIPPLTSLSVSVRWELLFEFVTSTVGGDPRRKYHSLAVPPSANGVSLPPCSLYSFSRAQYPEVVAPSHRVDGDSQNSFP